MSQTNRLSFMDSLKFFVVIMVVTLHGSIIYMAYAPDNWAVVDHQKSLFFSVIVVLIDVPVMQIMFFVAGYFALPSLFRQGCSRFIKGKLIRLGAPWVVGVLLFAPLKGYLTFFSRNRLMPKTFAEYWSSDFWLADFQQSVYWFLGVLLLFFLILTSNFETLKRRSANPAPNRKPTIKLLLVFWVAMSLSMFFMNQFFQIGTWFTDAYIIVFQPLRLGLYIGYFCLGIYAYENEWLSERTHKTKPTLYTGIWLISGVLYLIVKSRLAPNLPPATIWLQLCHALLFNAFCLTSLFIGIVTFDRLNSAQKLKGHFGSSSYGIYYIHQLILYPLAYFLVPVNLPLFIKAPLVIGSTIILSWFISSHLLAKAPVIRRAFT